MRLKIILHREATIAPLLLQMTTEHSLHRQSRHSIWDQETNQLKEIIPFEKIR